MTPGETVIDPQGQKWTVKIGGVGSVLLTRPAAIRWTTTGELRAWAGTGPQVSDFTAPPTPIGREGLIRRGDAWVRA